MDEALMGSFLFLLKGVLDGAGFPAVVTAHFVPMEGQQRPRTTILIKFAEEVLYDIDTLKVHITVVGCILKLVKFCMMFLLYVYQACLSRLLGGLPGLTVYGFMCPVSFCCKP